MGRGTGKHDIDGAPSKKEQIELIREEREYLLTLKAEKVERNKLTVAKDIKKGKDNVK